MTSRTYQSSSPRMDERTPLIASSTVAITSNDSSNELSVLQLSLLCASRFVEALSVTAVYPFIYNLVFNFPGIPRGEVQIWTGVAASIFSLAQLLLFLFWGRTTDWTGRKPILMISLVGFGVSIATLGLAGSKWDVVILSFLAGAFSSGIIVTSRTMVAENSTFVTQARAFSFLVAAPSIGGHIGPHLGSALSNPDKHSYALPGLVSGAAILLVAIACYIWLDETLPSRASSTSTIEPVGEIRPDMSVCQVVVAPGVRPALGTVLYAGMLSSGLATVLPMYLFTPVHLGGLGLNLSQLSRTMAARGLAQVICILGVFPFIQKRLGTGSLLRYCATAWPVVLALVAGQNPLLRAARNPPLGFVLMLVAVIPSGISMVSVGTQLILNDASPSSGAFGTYIGVALTLQSVAGGVSSEVMTAIYSLGISQHILWGLLGWVCLIVLAAGFPVTLFGLPAKSEISPHRSEFNQPGLLAAEDGHGARGGLP
ncbi:MFS general substrate transporter [Auriculariales sp. MPI-PUGE-AT-0066]|nr:MFS general substrate transporter [Auriculariales sp. MPI-PUGE-AT-0066]